MKRTKRQEVRPGSPEDIMAMEFRVSIAAKTLAEIDPKDDRFFHNYEFLRHAYGDLTRSRICALSMTERRARGKVTC